MSMHNLLVHKYNYSMTSENLWNCYRDEVNDDANENNAANCIINNNKKTSEYRTKLIGRTPAISSRLDTKVVVPLKCFSNFWRSCDLPLINCEIEHHSTWSKDFVIFGILRTAAEKKTTEAIFQMNSTKFSVPIVTLSINNYIKFLENMKQGF